jgi:NAD(P)-dependent dehydrogenase (short-subunit alcohol dehydrogenase family)
VGRNPAALEATEAEVHAIAPNVELLSVSVDISSEAGVAALFESIKSRFGTVDVLVNNAGIIAAENVPFKDGAFAEWWSNFVSGLLPVHCRP